MMFKKAAFLGIIIYLIFQPHYSLAFPKVKPGININPIDAPADWSENNSYITKNDTVIKWWDQFNDKQLSTYISDVANFNYDLQKAIARIQESKALKAGLKTTLYPQIDSSAKYSRYQFFAATNNATGKSLDLINAGFDSFWEIDLFGKNRWQVIAANERVEEANEFKRAVLISLISGVAKNYMELRGNQAQLVNLKDNIECQSKSLELVKSGFKIGLIPEIDVIRTQTLLESLKAQVPELEAAIKSSIYNISVLTGRKPNALIEELLPDKSLPEPPANIDVGLPADLIMRRPDIKQAQRNLAANLASVGASKADLYPSIKIKGSIGLGDISTKDLINITGGLWSVIPSINWKIFDRRSLKANLDTAKARVQSSDADLRQAVLNALKEVEISINNIQGSRNYEKELNSATESSHKAYSMTGRAYQIGLKNQIEVLDSQRTYLNNKTQLIDSKKQVNLDIINLYKALGGGWQNF